MITKNDIILVTGGMGFLGQALQTKLKEAGYGNIRTFSSRDWDLTDPNATQAVFKTYHPAVVIHLAAKVGGIGANLATPATFCRDNLLMGINVIDQCHDLRVKKLIIAGTICMFPCITPVPFREDNLWLGYPEPSNAPYGIAKKTLLVMAQSYRKQYGDNFVFLLPVNLMGPHDHVDLQKSHVIPAMIRKFHEAKLRDDSAVILWGDGSPTREFLYVEDCAEAFIAAMEKYDGELPINIGSGKEISIFDLAHKVKDLVGFSGDIIWDKTKPNGQPRRCLDVSRAKELLGWQSKTSFDEGLKKTYEWYLSSL